MRRQSRARIYKRKLFIVSILCLSLMPMTAYAEAAAAATSASGSVPAERMASDPAGAAKEKAKPEAKITKEEAVAIVRALFPQLNKAEARQVELGNNHSFPAPYQNVWNISWQLTSGNSSYGFNSLVDSISGELLQTHVSGPFEDENQAYYPPKVSEEEAFKLAKAFLFKASPGLTEDGIRFAEQPQYAEGSLFGPVQYYFHFSTLVGGLPSPNETISITVNGNGEVTGYNRNKTVAEYPSPTPSVSFDDAARKYGSAFDLSLQYIPVYKPYGLEKTWFLGWAPAGEGEWIIDAHTGDFLNFAGENVRPGGTQYKSVPKSAGGFEPVKGLDANGLLTSDQASELVEAISPVVKSRTRSSTHLNNHWSDKNKRVWNISWSEKTPAGPYGGQQSNAVVDAATGQIIEFRENGMFPPYLQRETEPESGTAAAITEEEAEAKAIEWVNRLYPRASEELKRVTPDPFAAAADGNKKFSFRFQRFIGDIPVRGDLTTVSMDASGKLISYTTTRSDQVETAAAGLRAKATKAEAEAAYREAFELKLQYRNFGGFYSDNGYIEPKIKLIYGPALKDERKSGAVYDATTGEWRSVKSEAANPKDMPKPLPTDVTGHRAQKELETLVRYGILKPDDSGKLHPDETVSVGDWLNMVAQAVNPYYAGSGYGNESKPAFEDIAPDSPYYAAAQLFVQSKWLDPKAAPKLGAEDQLTRERLAVLLVNIAKYGKLAAQMNGEAELSFADRDQIKQRGAVWIAVKLGFFDGKQREFGPERPVSKAEAAVALMRLVYLQGKLDQSIAR